ncbi:MAG TPA: hypothetical protein DCO79_01885 [Spirochaeta sp.]|nr:hypothetical protein [Spirochaeta sp.]
MENLDGVFRCPFLLDGKSKTEWLETNGTGAFASSTIIERNDRKYHGLLVTPIDGYEGRYHILSAVDAVFDADSEIHTGTTRYPDAHYPDGWKNLDNVRLIPFKRWEYGRKGIRITKEIFMREGEAAVYIVYYLVDGPESINADLKFLFTYRNVHDLTCENDGINTGIDNKPDCIRIRPYDGLPQAEINFSGSWTQSGAMYWDKNICYESEKERGHEWVEDRFVPGNTTISLEKGKPFVVRVSIDETESIGSDKLIKNYNDEKKEREDGFAVPSNGIELLKQQSHHFILKNPSGKKSINAGYPWFGEWGRDTMLALPGLTFYSGRTELGIAILSDYISMIKDGLLPNTLGDTQGYTSYNSIDAGLLFCWAINKLIDFGYGGRPEEISVLVKTFLPAVEQIVTAMFEGSVPNAGLNNKGLMYSGTVATQLTWMDATAWGKPVTPRQGYAVELNALWYDALYLYNYLSEKAGAELPAKARQLLQDLPSEFQSLFMLDEGYLSDTVNDYGPDKKLRPNMLFASSARPGLLSLEQRRSVSQAAEKHLLTEFGLRTLSPSDHEFKNVYSGGPDERDSKYHQGTVWPWLLGIMIESSLMTDEDIAKKSIFWSDYIEKLLSSHLTRDGWGSVSEIFDGLIPRGGKGTFAQAWSCGEIIRSAEIINMVKRNGNNKEGKH